MATKSGKKNAKPTRRKRPGLAAVHLNVRRAFDHAVDAFYEDDDPEQALTLLQQIEAQGPMSPEVTSLYLEVLHALRRFDDYARIANLLAERFPDDPDANLLAASGAYTTMQPVSAILYFEQVLKLAPEHPAAAVAKAELKKLRHHLPEILDAFLDELPKELPRIAAVEKILHLFKLGRFDDVVQRAKRHLQMYPADLRIRNNMAEALSLKGDEKQALKMINETLALAPDNFFARAVHCRMTYFQGQTEESKADAQRLVCLNPRQISDLTKAAQTFAYIGDPAGIHWAYEQAEQRKWLKDSAIDAALLTNYYATSLAFAGDIKSAKSLWKRAEQFADQATTAQENLDDLKQPAGERWGPAYLDVRDWFTQTQQNDIRSIAEVCDGLNQDDDENSVTETLDESARRFLKMHPDVERLIPGMLNRGNALCQQLAIILARTSQHPDVKAALLAYVQGARGTDAIRLQLLRTVKENGYRLESPLAFYSQGEEHQVELLGFQISDEPKDVPAGRSDETSDLLFAANEALQAGDGADAERLLRQVYQIEPEQPDVLNNLAAALQLQNRTVDANLLVDQLIENHPDYFFSKIAVAGRAIRLKDYDKAHEVLIDLQQCETLHTTEFFALARFSIYTYVGKGETAAAQRWLGMLKEYAPDHPEIPSLSQMIEGRQFLGGMVKNLIKRK